jgi:hypothetical protein
VAEADRLAEFDELVGEIPWHTLAQDSPRKSKTRRGGRGG